LHCAPKIELPTMLAFDLDPGEGADIVLCAQVGLWIRDLLADLGIQSFPKTSGSKGLQLYVPLNTPTNYDKTKTFAHALAERLESEHPDRIVSKMQKRLRIGKVFVDWSQNDEHKTTVTVYSLRAKDRPTVSTPVSWEEVERALKKGDPKQLEFDSDEVLERMEKNGDLFEPVLKIRQKLPSLKALAEARGSDIAGRARPSRKSSKTKLRSISEPKTEPKPVKELRIPIAEGRSRSEVDISALRQLRPMLAKSASAAFDDPEWIFEIKLDGYRALALVDPTDARLISRAGNELSSAYPAIVDDLLATNRTAVFDGEIVVLDDSGIPKFELLQSYRTARQGHLVYYVFDLLFLNGRDLRNHPLVQRKETLRKILNGSEIVRYVEHVDGSGKQFFDLARERGLEGIVAKKKSASYLTGKRVDHWLKIKCRLVTEAIICGFTESRVNQNTLGALLVGVYQVGRSVTRTGRASATQLMYAGLVGTGLNRAPTLAARLRKLATTKRLFKKVPKTDMPICWVEPELVCSVEFQEWTKDGILRGASLLSLK
jgi:DNA ligase D-like protein (predicted ligase)